MGGEPIVELEQVTKRFGRTVAVDELSMSVARQSVHGFIGPNGSGKTTTLRMILGLFYPDSGVVRVLGGPPAGRLSDRIGYLPEERGLYRKMTVREVLRYYSRLKGFRARPSDVDAWLERLKIDQWADTIVEVLSKGTA